MSSKISTVIFDYGGTLDTGGIHWSEKFWEAYQFFKIPINRDEYRNAFIYSEKNVAKNIKSESSLKDTYSKQLFYQIKYLEKNNIITGAYHAINDEMVEYCYRSVIQNNKETRMLLGRLSKEYKLGIVSNYYGNLNSVLNEIGLKKYFSIIIDSELVGVRKPNSKIISIAVGMLDSKPEETIVVGDSYKNDITPSKRIGCYTIWLDVKGWETSQDTINADIKIKSLNDVESAIKKILYVN